MTKTERRSFLKFGACVLSSGISLVPTLAQSQSHQTSALPNASTFQSGDLLWPKKPNAYVPYHAGGSGSPEDEAVQWQTERKQFLDSVGKQGTHLTSDDIRHLKGLDYQSFYALYAGDRKPSQFVPYSSGEGVYVGHVGIIHMDEKGVPWVIEALTGSGVIRQSYAAWLSSRPGQIVWHGRLKALDSAQRAQIAVESRKYVDRPYNFWNFDLNDDTVFYCSKLVWLSVFRSLGFPVDGNKNPKRSFWFSPKQLMNAPSIARLHNPTEY